MEAVNGVSDGGGGGGGGPPPPSPLTGCYLLIVIGEPHTQEHKNIILQRIVKGLLSWDINDCLIDLEKELAIITEQAPEGEEARYGERLIQYASENLVTEVLIHPAVSTLAQCVRNLLSSFTRHRHIIHAGYTFAANGSWILQDGTFSYTDFAEAFHEIEVQRVIRAYENSISVDVHCSSEGDWTKLPKESFAKSCKVRVNPVDVLNSGSPSITNFLNYISPFLIPTDVEALLECSDVVGNIRFSHPTLYIFPGGQGDAALFGINGFNMLLDGGFSRKACFWDFVRHLDRLDAVMLTRLNNGNASGISAVLRRKMQNALYPQIGHFFCNIQERKSILSPDGDKDKDPLLINLLDEGQELITNLKKLNLTPQVCYRDSEPINLYHKVGHGTLDMYVLSPAKESKEVRDFLHRWNTNDQKLFANQRSSKDFQFPLQNMVSICALLIWQPANPNDNITRILYPGSTPQQKIFEGLDRLKNLEYIKYPVCSESKLITSSSIMTLKSKQLKDASLEKLIQPDTKKFEKLKEKPPKSGEIKKIENKLADSLEKQEMTNGVSSENETDKTVKKSDSTDSEKSIKSSKPKKSDDKIDDKRSKPESKPKVRTKIDSKPEKKKMAEKKASPTTPKKTIEAKTNGEIKEKPISKPMKYSPSATPAKSAKEATNRKVIESKNRMAAKKDIQKPAPEKKEVKPERKPISRRAKGPSPTTKTVSSPIKKVTNGVVQKPDIIKKAKLDKEGTTDSSTVSTPSADQKDLTKLTPDEIEALKAQELADLKEEQEVVKEIEAVFRKGEVDKDSNTELRKIKDISIEDKSEPEEYLIIEKEEVEHDSLEDKDTKEDEIQKHTRDSEESEKMRKLSDDIKISLKGKEELEKEDQAIQDETPIEPKDKDEKEKPVDTSKEISATSPEDRIDLSADKKTNDLDNQEQNVALESQPDERYSATIESGATTAPTLPEDERITLDEIKEDNGDQAIEEKHVKEDTKEKDVPVIQLPAKTFEPIPKIPPVVGIRLDKQSHIRDIVKTPDEVADLPVHEEADIDQYQMEKMNIKEKMEEDIVEEKDRDTTVKDTKEEIKDTAEEKDKDTIVNGITEEIQEKDIKDEEIKIQKIETKSANEIVETVPEKTKEVIKSDIERDAQEVKEEGQKLEVIQKEEHIEMEEKESEDKEKIQEKDETIQMKVDTEKQTKLDEKQETVEPTVEIKDEIKESIKEKEKEATVEIKDEIKDSKEDIKEKDEESKVSEKIKEKEQEEVKELDEKVPVIEEEIIKESVSLEKDNIKETKDAVKDLKEEITKQAAKVVEELPGQAKDIQMEKEIKAEEEIEEKVKESEIDDKVKEVDEETKTDLKKLKVKTDDINDLTQKIETLKEEVKEIEIIDKDPKEKTSPKEAETEVEKLKESKEITPEEKLVEAKMGDMPLEVTSKEERVEEITKEDELEEIKKEEKTDDAKKEEKIADAKKEEKSQDEKKEEKFQDMKMDENLKEPQIEEKIEDVRKAENVEVTKVDKIEDVNLEKQLEEIGKEKKSEIVKKEGDENKDFIQESKIEDASEDAKKDNEEEGINLKEQKLEESTKEEQIHDKTKDAKIEIVKKEENLEKPKKEEKLGDSKKDDEVDDMEQQEKLGEVKAEEKLEDVKKEEKQEEAKKEKLEEEKLEQQKKEVITDDKIDKVEDEKLSEKEDEKCEEIAKEKKVQESQEEKKLSEIKQEDMKEQKLEDNKKEDKVEQTPKITKDEKSEELKKDDIKIKEEILEVQDKSDKLSTQEVKADTSTELKDEDKIKETKFEVEESVLELTKEEPLKDVEIVPKIDDKNVEKLEHVEHVSVKEEAAMEDKLTKKIEYEEPRKFPPKEDVSTTKIEKTEKYEDEKPSTKDEMKDVKMKGPSKDDSFKSNDTEEKSISEQKMEEVTISTEEEEIAYDEREDLGKLREDGHMPSTSSEEKPSAKEKTPKDLILTGESKKIVEDVLDSKEVILEKKVLEEKPAIKTEEQIEVIKDNEAKLLDEIEIQETKESDVTFYIGDQKLEKTKTDTKDEKPVETKEEKESKIEEKDVDDKQKFGEELKNQEEVSGLRDIEDTIGEKKADELIQDKKDEGIKIISGSTETTEEIAKQIKYDKRESESPTPSTKDDLETKTELKESKIEKEGTTTEKEPQQVSLATTSDAIYYDSNKYANGFDEKLDVKESSSKAEKPIMEDEKGTKEIHEQKREKDIEKDNFEDQCTKTSSKEHLNGELKENVETVKESLEEEDLEKEKVATDKGKEKNLVEDVKESVSKETLLKGVVKTDSDDNLPKAEDTKEDVKSLEQTKDSITIKEPQLEESLTDSPETSLEQSIQTFKEAEILDKTELGRKSPKEREEDVAIIVASVAEVLKSDAPLEEFEGKIPLNIAPFVPFTTSYTVELKETHITTVDSPVTDVPKGIIDTKSLPETIVEKEEEDTEKKESKLSDLLRDSKELMEATSKMISEIKSSKSEEPPTTEEGGIVHRMLVTASSEDGGEEIEICAKGSITFSRSSESSGRSSPEQTTQKLKPEEKIPSGKSTPDIKITSEQEKADVEDTEKDLPDEKSSGRVSPDIRDQSPTPDSGITETVRQEMQRSGKSTPDGKEKISLAEADKKSSDSGRSTPEAISSKLETLEEPVLKLAFDSGRSTPDSKSLEDLKQEEKIEIKSVSGKSTPETPKLVESEKKSTTSDSKTDTLSEKSISPDVKKDATSVTEPSDLTSVSDLKDSCHQRESASASVQEDKIPELEKSVLSGITDISGKSTPDITQSIMSGKSTPDLKLDSESIISRTSTPGFKDKIEKDDLGNLEVVTKEDDSAKSKDLTVGKSETKTDANILKETDFDEDLKSDEIPPAYEDLEKAKLEFEEVSTSETSPITRIEDQKEDFEKLNDLNLERKESVTLKDEEDNIVKEPLVKGTVGDVQKMDIQVADTEITKIEDKSTKKPEESEKVDDKIVGKEESIKIEAKIDKIDLDKDKKQLDKDTTDIKDQTTEEKVSKTDAELKSEKIDKVDEKPRAEDEKTEIKTEDMSKIRDKIEDIKKPEEKVDSLLEMKEDTSKEIDQKLSGTTITGDIVESKKLEKVDETIDSKFDLNEQADIIKDQKIADIVAETKDKIDVAKEGLSDKLCEIESKKEEVAQKIEEKEADIADLKLELETTESKFFSKIEEPLKDSEKFETTLDLDTQIKDDKDKEKDALQMSEEPKVEEKPLEISSDLKEVEEKSKLQSQQEDLLPESKEVTKSDEKDSKLEVVEQKLETEKSTDKIVTDFKTDTKNEEAKISELVSGKEDPKESKADQTLDEKIYEIKTSGSISQTTEVSKSEQSTDLIVKSDKETKEIEKPIDKDSHKVEILETKDDIIKKLNDTKDKLEEAKEQTIVDIKESSKLEAKIDSFKAEISDSSKPQTDEIIKKDDEKEIKKEPSELETKVDITKQEIAETIDISKQKTDDETKVSSKLDETKESKEIGKVEKENTIELIMLECEKQAIDDISKDGTLTIKDEIIEKDVESKVSCTLGEVKDQAIAQIKDISKISEVKAEEFSKLGFKHEETSKIETKCDSFKEKEADDQLKLKSASDSKILTQVKVDDSAVKEKTISLEKPESKIDESESSKTHDCDDTAISKVVIPKELDIKDQLDAKDLKKSVETIHKEVASSLDVKKEITDISKTVKLEDATKDIDTKTSTTSELVDKNKDILDSDDAKSAKLEESKSQVVDETSTGKTEDSSKTSVIVDKAEDKKTEGSKKPDDCKKPDETKTESSAHIDKTVDKDLGIGKQEDTKVLDSQKETTIKDSKEFSIASSSKELIMPEESGLSGKSTPDIADVERDKQLQETLSYEKHIPGSSTPPTVPVSPIVKDMQTEIKSEITQKLETPILCVKDQDIRSGTPGSDDYEHGVSSTHSDISSSQMSRAPNLLEEEETRASDEEDILGSPTSVTSQIGHSPSSQYDFDEDKRLTKINDQMTSSFYGTLPGEMEESGFKSGRFLDDSDLDFEKAMQEHRQTRGEDLTGEQSYLYEITTAKYTGGAVGMSSKDSLGKKTDIMTSSFISTELPGRSTDDKDKEKDPIGSWGKPLGLPSPAPPDNKGTPKKEKKLPANVTAKNKLNDDRKRSESPSKYDKKQRKAGGPIYVDLTYVPHHGNSNYSYVDFFKRIRARYYVFSGIEPSKEVYNALLEAKQTWEDKDLEVTIIPTYDTDVLGYWVAENEELLTKYKIDLSPSASRCTINLQDHETSCSAYRLEF